MVRLQGLDIMNDDPSAADVVYIKVQEVGDKRLIPVCGKWPLHSSIAPSQ